ncbi:Uncharacterized protein CT_035 [Durusdinium trenchii]|uniref:Uncharacterized protein CT_035 n=1 Tax=Durusdinium trenchii TaxID=1381693 RepID=A0ABP0ISR0_9DINO
MSSPHSTLSSRLRIAWIADPKKFGTKPGYPKPSLRDRLQREGGFSFVRLTAAEVKKGALQTGNYDIFIVPGGYAPNYADALGELGGERIRSFVKAGGGYVGICAGAYLGTSWGYDLLPVNVLDIDHWDRGKTADCRLRPTAAGKKIAGSLQEEFAAPYANGPLLEILDSAVDSLVDFQSQLCGKKGTYPKLMQGSPAVVAGPHGKGRVLLISPHIEGNPALGDAFRSFVKWTAGGLSAMCEAPVPESLKPQETEGPQGGMQENEAKNDKPLNQSVLEASSITEADVTQISQKFDLNKDGKLDFAELEMLLTSLQGSDALSAEIAGLLEQIQQKESGGIQYEEFIAWAFGAPCLVNHDVCLETDGEEDAVMDKPSMIRMQSSAQYGTSTPDSQEAQPAQPPVLMRTCSDGCSGKQQVVSPEKLEASVVAIQRAARAMKSSETEKDTQNSSGSKECKEEVPQVPVAKTKAGAKAKASALHPPAPILQRGGLDFVCCLGGPILITAPHSMKIVRGGGGTLERTRNHKQERWTAEISMLVARELYLAGLPASVMVWNRIAGPGRGRLDPNYLLRSQFNLSPWHRALHKWATKIGGGGPATDAGIPLLHVDLHGKVSEKLHLDLGAAPLEEVWPEQDQSVVRALKFNFCKKLDKALADCRVLSQKGKQIKVEADPALHGFWGADTVTTISHQSVLLGIPAVQFEMPPRLREQLINNPVATP